MFSSAFECGIVIVCWQDDRQPANFQLDLPAKKMFTWTGQG